MYVYALFFFANLRIAFAQFKLVYLHNRFDAKKVNIGILPGVSTGFNRVLFF